MTERQKLSKAVGLIAWGYFFIYFNLNLGPIDVLPNFVGYFLYHKSVSKKYLTTWKLALIFL